MRGSNENDTARSTVRSFLHRDQRADPGDARSDRGDREPVSIFRDGREPSQHRGVPGRRPRLGRPGLLRPPADQDAEPRRVRPAGRAAHAVLRGVRRLLAVAVGHPDRPHAAPQRRLPLDRRGERGPSAGRARSRWPSCSRGGLRDLPRRQVAPERQVQPPEQPQPNDHGYEHWMATQNNAAPSHKNPANFVRNGQPARQARGLFRPARGGRGDRLADARSATRRSRSSSPSGRTSRTCRSRPTRGSRRRTRDLRRGLPPAPRQRHAARSRLRHCS